MTNNKNQQKFDSFRLQYEKFIFESYTYELDVNKNLHIKFNFWIDEIHNFKPTIIIPFREDYLSFYNKHSIKELDTIIFHIGMIELISYWKCTCTKQIIIKPYQLTERQIDFWKKIYYKGLGEFFYTNGITSDLVNFTTIQSVSDNTFSKVSFNPSSHAIIPIGGGKDSNVTLSMAKQLYTKTTPLILNPRGATLGCIEVAGYDRDSIFEINRAIDPHLIALNDKGYLNGHTPFSALLAFITLLVGTLSETPNVLLSNESSANEATIIGSDVNHQYSKSFEFESDFRDYVNTHLTSNFNYYSFLRPLSELQIAALFSRLKQYHPIFKSCNVGSKNDVWCCNCSKCLFTFTILSAFIPMDELIQIYGENLFEKESLLPELKELTGITPIKPFECIGTVEEVNLSLWKTIQEFGNSSTLPFLLSYFKQSNAYKAINPSDINDFMEQFETKHFLSEEAISLLKKSLLWTSSKN